MIIAIHDSGFRRREPARVVAAARFIDSLENDRSDLSRKNAS
jgi:hypothetical protein